MKDQAVSMETQDYAARIGLDWADQKHDWSMLTADGHKKHGQLDNTPEAIEVWATELARQYDGRLVAVALEQSRGAVIAMLSKYAHRVLFPVHSTTMANYRKAFSPSGAKSDSGDSGLILDLLIKHPERFRRWQPDTVETRSLQFLSGERRKLVDQHTSQSQQLTGWLKQIYPQILRWFEDVSSPLVADLLTRWPTLEQLQKAAPQTLRQFLHQHHSRGEERIEQRLAEIRQAVPATNDSALLQTGVICIRNCVAVLAQMRTGIAAFDRQIAEVFRSHPDRALVESFPGAGPALEPRLIAAVGSLRERFDSAESLACFAGIAPVQQSSGNSRWVHWRWACPKFIRQTFHEWANCSIRCCDWARAYYDQQRARGQEHHAAIRALAYKWIRIFYRCWRDRVLYSESRYLESLKQRCPRPVAPPTPPAPKQPAPKQNPVALQIEWKKCAGFSRPVKIIV